MVMGKTPHPHIAYALKTLLTIILSLNSVGGKPLFLEGELL
jgi:hypothetical protein